MHQRVSSHSKGKSWLLHNVMKIFIELYCNRNISLVTLQYYWFVKYKICKGRKDYYTKGKGSWLQSHLMQSVHWGCIIPFTLVLHEGAQRVKVMLICSSNVIVQRYCTRSFIWQVPRPLRYINFWESWKEAGCSQGKPSFPHLRHLQNSTEYVGEELADDGRWIFWLVI